MQPETRNIISNKRTERAISHGKDNNNGRPVNKSRSVSNSVSAGSWLNQEVDETAAARSRNQRFPLSTTSDPWSQATWPEEDDGFFLKPRNQAINSTEWAVPADLTDPWQGRLTDSWDGVGSREHPITVDEDPLRTRERDILARQQKQHDQRSSGFAQQVANKSTFEVRSFTTVKNDCTLPSPYSRDFCPLLPYLPASGHTSLKFHVRLSTAPSLFFR